MALKSLAMLFGGMLAAVALWVEPLGASDFAPVRPGRTLHFPEDSGAHPDFRTEWWYITGWLTNEAGEERGFQITFFRIGTGLGAENPSRFAPRQLILAHAAVADPALGRLRHVERIERAFDPLAGAGEGATRVWIRDWELRLDGALYRARIQTDELALEFEFIPPAPPLLNGAAGFSQKAPDPLNASYYYSRPQLAVSGQLRLGDGEPEQVRGRAWLDHEWSSELLPSEAQGWDWIGINLHHGGSLMAFRMRGRDGAALWHGGTLHEGEGAVRRLGPEDLSFTPGRRWRSPRSGVEYPVEWTLRLDDRQLVLSPLMDDQELDSRAASGVLYWEGAVRLLEEGREIGRGYLEMTGYGERPKGL